MFDNRASKTNPKAPDFKCKNSPKTKGGPGCEGVIWPQKPGQRAAYSPPPAAAKTPQAFASGPHIPEMDGPYTETGAPPDVESGSVYPKLQRMFSVYDVCLDHVLTTVAPKMAATDIGTSPESAAAMVATLYISAKDAGLTR